MRLANAVIPIITDEDNLERLIGLIKSTLLELGNIRDADRADNALLDNISQDLKLKLGLIIRQAQ